MTATKQLRKLLDERGVEWRAYTDQTRGAMELFYSTYFDTPNGCKARATSTIDSDLLCVTFRTNPEQAIAATLGSGKLTADDVRDLIERHSDAAGGNGRDFHNGAYEAIADELNATLGGGECEIVEHYAASTRGEIGRERVKLSCGHIVERHSKFCQECGARIRKAVKR